MRHPSPHKVASLFRRARGEVQDAAEGVFDGVPPDGGEWHGGPARWHTSFSGLKSEVLGQKEMRDGSIEFTIKIGADPEKDRYQDGVYVDTYLFHRFLQRFPRDERALLDVATKRVRGMNSKFASEIKSYFESGKFGWNLMSAVFGHQESKEWENPTNTKVSNIKIGSKPTYRGRQIHFPWSAKATFQAVKKAPLNEGPFDSMSDRELDRFIYEYESQAPENFWMDGELRMSRSRAYAYYRKQWRNKSPRDQLALYESLKQWMR